MLKPRYKTSTRLVDYQQAFQTMENAVANWLDSPTSSSQRRLGSSNKKDLFEESSLLDPSLRWDDAGGVAEDGDRGVVWFLEHPALYTEGTSADQIELLDGHSLPVYKTNRGGKFTYHGPGQRVVYLVLDLKKLFAPNPPDAKSYVFFLEQVIIEILKDLGLVGLRIANNPGVWVQTEDGLAPKKIAFIGIRIKKWISYHGLAFNIAPNLEHFKGIIPCGVKEYGITSLKELGKEITAEEFDKRFKENFERLLKEGL